jgi:hypothetical protein
MADNSSQRSVRQPGYLHAPRNSSGNDPLAELARLIGQTDPFAEFGRQQSQQPAQPGSTALPQGYATQQPQPYDQRGYQAPDEAVYPQEQYAEPEYDPNVYYEDAPGLEGGQDYDDEPPRRRGGIIAVAAVLALAVVGTAGAFGYKALFGASGSAPPPVIKADTTPTKVVPPSKSEPQSSKLIYDRVGERAGSEKIVSREEQPIDIKDSKPASPANVSPGVIGNAAQAAASTTSESATAVDQPKKIHTIAIRPDSPPTLDPTPPASSPTPPRSAAVTSPAPAPAPKPVATPPKPPTRLASAPAGSTTDAEETVSASRPGPTPVHPAAPSHNANAPLSLSPNAVSAPAARPTPRTRTASVPPPTRAAAPAAGGGHYAVQVSSQRSEADAEAAFRSLQAKFPSQLGGRQPLIRRADLGSKGIYYRAMVGPFASADEASSLCQSLKSAGGSCLIQKN